MCFIHQTEKVVEERPDLVGNPGPEDASPADIIWTNRGLASDGFDARFGTLAATARGVVDAVIVAYERMIGTFNYTGAAFQYSLTVSMSSDGSGFGASAGLGTSLGGKPKSGTITMGAGNADGNANSDNGWFLDPTPFESSEFQGTIENAFAMSAQAGSPALSKGDFYSVVASEMTHCMGLFGSALTLWSSHTTNTLQDDPTASGTSTLWTFIGANIKHLLTSTNGGSDFGSAVHSGEPASTYVSGPDTYNSNNDQGNWTYSFSQRTMVNQTFALMFKDAYNYGSVNPAQFATGTAFVNRNQTTQNVLVRSSASSQLSSNDTLSITRVGNVLTISVDPDADVAGSGNLPGPGNVAAWVTNFDLTVDPVTSITVQMGAGNDNITIGSNVGLPITVDGGTGTDSIIIAGTTSGETVTITPTTISSGATSITGFAATVEGITANLSDGNDTLVVDQQTGDAVPTNGISYDGGIGSDSLTMIGSTGANTVTFNNGNVAYNGTTTYTTTETLNFDGKLGLDVVTVNGGLNVSMSANQRFASLTMATATSASLATNGNLVIYTNGLSLTGSANLDLFDNDMLVEYTGATQLPAVQTLINNARNGGAWNGTGIDSNAAATASPANTTLGAMEASDYLSLGNTTFDGQTIDGTCVLVKYTYYGDTDFSGEVDFDDFVRTDGGYNAGQTGWFNGDNNGDGTVDFDDYVAIDFSYNTQVGIL